MKLRAHDLAAPAVFEQHLPISLSLFDRMKGAVEAKTGDLQVAYGQLVRGSLKHACIALILAREDREVQRSFHEAVSYGMSLLEARSGAGARIYDVRLEVSERGTERAAMHERRPQKGEGLLPVTDFSSVLTTTIAFGDEAQRGRVASYPEERYSNPDIVAPTYLYGNLRALKAWLRGEEALARGEAEAVVSACPEAGPKAGMATFLALVARDQMGFETQLEEHLKAHKKHYQKNPHDPLGMVSIYGLALCRLASERGLRVEEWPYLPTRLLPSHADVVH